MPTTTTDLFRSLRPRHWVKNVFVLAPLVFSGEVRYSESVGVALIAAAAFCLASSAVYLINDVIDREADRAHPTKRHRPVAAGRISTTVALISAAALAGVALLVAAAVTAALAAIIAAYLVMSVAYSVWLKRVVIIDVMVIATGFVLRVLAGAEAISVEPSIWLLICMGFLALMLGFGKRRGEARLLQEGSASHRAVLEHYSPMFADSMVLLTAGLSLAAYAAYSATGRPAENHMALTLPFVIYGVFRYLWLVFHEQRGESPTDIAWSDVPIILAVAGWGASAALLLVV